MSTGQVVDVLLREHRDLASAQAFFRRAIATSGKAPAHVISDDHQPYVKSVQRTAPQARHIRTGLHRRSGDTTKHRAQPCGDFADSAEEPTTSAAVSEHPMQVGSGWTRTAAALAVVGGGGVYAGIVTGTGGPAGWRMCGGTWPTAWGACCSCGGGAGATAAAAEVTPGTRAAAVAVSPPVSSDRNMWVAP
jgi:hypothetical protein